MARVSVTVVVPTYQREDPLLETLRHVEAQERVPDEVLVIDQSPRHTPETAAALAAAERAGKIRCIRQQPASLTKARNRGLQEARGDVVLFLDDDVLLPDGLVATHLRHFERGEVDAVGGPTLDAPAAFDWRELPAGDPRAAAVRMPNNSGRWAAGIPHLVGCNHSVLRDRAIRIGGYDELFVGSAYCEDGDFALRLYEAGGRFVYDPAAWLIHRRVPSGGCRVVGNLAWREWQKTVCVLLFAMRHGRSVRNRRALWIEALRMGPFRRENVVRPWRWPWAWAGFAYAMYEARWRAWHPVVSPFSNDGLGGRVFGDAVTTRP
jgi:glycosyltransferase involved in cell wall biosynthesis